MITVEQVLRNPFAKLGLFSAFVVSMAWYSSTPYLDHGPVLCLFRGATGLPCPFCGSTRAISEVCAGNVTQALHYNPVGVALFVVGIPLLFSLKLRIWFRSSAFWLKQQFGSHSVIILVTACYGMLWVWNITTRWR